MAVQTKINEEKTNGANLGFEGKLWKAADKLRSNMDAAEYKHVVLGLLFLKYISDAFNEVHDQLRKDPTSDPEDLDEYVSRRVFWVPKEARWDYLESNAKKPEIGKLIDDAMDAIERDNRSLRGVLVKNYARPGLDKQRLGELIDLVGTIGLGDKESRTKDILGRVYEYFLGQFASAEGKKGGHFYTPRIIVRLLVEMLEPYKGRIYDPCCGSGGMFVQSEKFIEAHGGRIGDISIYGQESNQTTWRLCKMNLAIRGIDSDLVDCMVALPSQLFYNTMIPACLWFVSRDKKNHMFKERRGHVLFIDARKLGTMVDRRHRELTVEDLKKISGAYHAWRGELKGEKYQDIPGFCKSSSLEEVRRQEWILTPGRYVGAEDEEDDTEPFEEKMKRLTAELAEQMKKGQKLDEEIKKNLESIGFELPS